MPAKGEEQLALIYGVHPVSELLRSRPGDVERIFAARDPASGIGRILRKARLAGVPVTYLPRPLLGRKLGRRAVHQGIAAEVAAIPYRDAAALCAGVRDDGLLVLLDRVTDPGNLGAVLRSCAAAGADGVILGGAGTVGLTPAAIKASAGTAEWVPVARDERPKRCLEALKERGFRVLGLDPGASTPWDEVDLTKGIIFVAGGENRGLRPGLARACDERIGIPLASGVQSLNVSVAVGVLLFETVRQRRQGGGDP